MFWNSCNIYIHTYPHIFIYSQIYFRSSIINKMGYHRFCQQNGIYNPDWKKNKTTISHDLLDFKEQLSLILRLTTVIKPCVSFICFNYQQNMIVQVIYSLRNFFKTRERVPRFYVIKLNKCFSTSKASDRLVSLLSKTFQVFQIFNFPSAQ